MNRTSIGSSSDRRPAAANAVPAAPEEIDRTLASLGVRPSRAHGQSFLVDPFVADALAAVAFPVGAAPVVEVGGGLGMVTRALLRRGAPELTVLERDPRLARFLRTTFGGAVRVVEADALSFDFPREAIVVGSLPYSIATPLVLDLFRRRVARVAAIVQKEVADRLGAACGSRAYGRPSILARLFGEVELMREIPPAAFYPVPKVASRLFVHRPRAGALPVESVDRLERSVRVLFSSRRKQLGNLLPRLDSRGAGATTVARRAAWPAGWERLRPESLPPEAYFRLERVLASLAERTDPPERED